MCNINILMKKKGIKRVENSKTPIFLKDVTEQSFERNRDGEGIYLNGIVEKSLKKINIMGYSEEILKSNLIITHQRLATSGYTQDFVHPFESEDFILVHNGIINDFLGDLGSDTSGFFNKLNKIFKKNTGTREERITKSLKKLLDGLNGSYSIALFDKKEKFLYYFKNNRTNINFYKSKNMLFITTFEGNSYFLREFKEDFKELIIKESSADEIQAQAEKEKMLTMFEDGFVKAVRRLTSVEEVLRVATEK